MRSKFDWLKFICFCLTISVIILSVIYYVIESGENSPLVYIFLVPFITGYQAYFFLAKFNCDEFSFSRMTPFSKSYNIHLSNPLIDKLKKIKKNEAENTISARNYLNDITEKKLVDEINFCFEKKNAKRIVMTSHHIGQEDYKKEVISHLTLKNFIIKENSISLPERYLMVLVLSIMLRSLKPLYWKFGRLDIYLSTNFG